ncbi:hypothetical protein BLOT_003399 [Blomia tropicalis]|nr:hypothetical protein BLOT_003399 [Blomia tropicalis]
MGKPNSEGSSSLHFAYCIPQFGLRSFVNTKPNLGSAATDRWITAGSSQSMEMQRYFHSHHHRAVPRYILSTYSMHTGYNLTKRLYCPTIILVTHAQEHCCIESKLRIAIGGSRS